MYRGSAGVSTYVAHAILSTILIQYYMSTTVLCGQLTCYPPILHRYGQGVYTWDIKTLFLRPPQQLRQHSAESHCYWSWKNGGWLIFAWCWENDLSKLSHIYHQYLVGTLDILPPFYLKDKWSIIYPSFTLTKYQDIHLPTSCTQRGSSLAQLTMLLITALNLPHKHVDAFNTPRVDLQFTLLLIP